MSILVEIWLQIIDLKTICSFQVISLDKFFLLCLVGEIIMKYILISLV